MRRRGRRDRGKTRPGGRVPSRGSIVAELSESCNSDRAARVSDGAATSRSPCPSAWNLSPNIFPTSVRSTGSQSFFSRFAPISAGLCSRIEAPMKPCGQSGRKRRAAMVGMSDVMCSCRITCTCLLGQDSRGSGSRIGSRCGNHSRREALRQARGSRHRFGRKTISTASCARPNLIRKRGAIFGIIRIGQDWWMIRGSGRTAERSRSSGEANNATGRSRPQCLCPLQKLRPYSSSSDGRSSSSRRAPR